MLEITLQIDAPSPPTTVVLLFSNPGMLQNVRLVGCRVPLRVRTRNSKHYVQIHKSNVDSFTSFSYMLII